MKTKELGLVLKNGREAKGYSTRDVSKFCTISQSYVSLIENGKRKPPLDVLHKFSELYNLDFMELLKLGGYSDFIDSLQPLSSIDIIKNNIEEILKTVKITPSRYKKLMDDWTVKRKIDITNLDTYNSILLNAYFEFIATQKPIAEKVLSNLSTQEIAKILNKNDNQFIEMLKQINVEEIITNEKNNIVLLQEDMKLIPVIGRVAAGEPLLADENIIDYKYAPTTYIKKDYRYFYLVVQGDSMNRKFHDGDYILVQKQDYIENDEIGVFLIDGEATVKKYYEEDGIIELRPLSTNPIHKKQEYNPQKIDFKIIGKVISYQGKV